MKGKWWIVLILAILISSTACASKATQPTATGMTAAEFQARLATLEKTVKTLQDARNKDAVEIASLKTRLDKLTGVVPVNAPIPTGAVPVGSTADILTRLAEVEGKQTQDRTNLTLLQSSALQTARETQDKVMSLMAANYVSKNDWLKLQAMVDAIEVRLQAVERKLGLR